MSRIHTFGDSHATLAWPKNIIKHHMGPMLCYSFGKEKFKRLDIKNCDVKQGDYVIFCFGEIDCRCHIHKHISKSLTYQNIIDNIIKNYIEAILLIMKEIEEIDIKVCIYNVVPPIQKYNTEENPKYPYLGSDDERKKYVLYFNKILKKYCILHDFIFFDVYNNYTDKNGFLSKELSDGNVHIRNGVFIDKFIAENM